MALDFLKALRQTGSKTRVARRSKEPTSFRTWLEPLEERRLLSTRVWDGDGANNGWTTAANWDAAVVAGDSLIFPAGVPTDSLTNFNNFPLNTAFASIELSGFGYTINGNPVALGADGLRVNSPAGAHVLNAPLLLDSVTTFEVAPLASLTVNGRLHGSGGLTKLGAGFLTLSGSEVNIYTGATNVNFGALRLGKASALGGIGTGTTVANGASLGVFGGVTFNAEPLVLNGVLGNFSSSGSNTWTGNITLASTSTIISSANTTLTVTGNISGGNLTKTSEGTLVLSGTGVNNYTGHTFVGGGVLEIRKASALGAVGAGTTVAAGAALHLFSGGTTVFDAEPLTLNGGALLNVHNQATWTGNITLAAASTIGSAASILTINGNIANAGFLLTVNDAGTTIFGGTGVLSGGGGLTKAGTGTLRLEGTGVNTYIGSTKVNAGKLNIRKASALGPAGGSGTSVANGAVLQLQGGVIFNSEALTLNGAGIGATGALRNISGNNTWPGNINLTAASTIGSDANTLTVNGNIANAGFLLTVAGAGNTVFGGAGVLGGAGGLTKTGTGTLTLEGTAANTYAGATTVNGTLRLNKQTAGTTAVPGALAINGLNAVFPGLVTLLNDNQIANGGAISINAFGTLALNNRFETIGTLTMFGGDITTGTGKLTLNGNLTATSASTTGPAEISGNLSLGGVNRTFTINDGTNSVDMLISAVISSGVNSSPGFPAGLNKAGPGTLQFTGNNTFPRTEISAGRLIVDGNQSDSPALNKGTIVHAGATLAGIGTLQPLTVNSGGTVSPGSTGIGVLTSQGNLILNGGSIFAAQVVPIFNVPSDRLAVAGSVNINSATLQVVSTFLPSTSPGATFVILDNDGADLVSGTFANLPENATFNVQAVGVLNGQVVVQNQSYRINYGSGDGNDVVLTYLNSATMARDLAVTPNVINEGEQVTLTGRLVDPDRRGHLTLQVDWGDGSPVEARQMGAAPFRLQHRYPLGQPSGGQYRINVAWFDRQGAGNNQDLFVTVNNVAASFELTASQSTGTRADLRRNGLIATSATHRSTAAFDNAGVAGLQSLERNPARRFHLNDQDRTPDPYTEIVTLRAGGGGLSWDRLAPTFFENSLSGLERFQIDA